MSSTDESLPKDNVKAVDSTETSEEAADADPESKQTEAPAVETSEESSQGKAVDGLDTKMASMAISLDSTTAGEPSLSTPDSPSDKKQKSKQESTKPAKSDKDKKKSSGGTKGGSKNQGEKKGAPAPAPQSPSASTPPAQPPAVKKEPYVNPDRHLTGGTKQDKLGEDVLAERIARIRQNNEKIKQRQLEVQADEDAFKATQAADAKRQAYNRKIQDSVDRTREQNAARKMEKMGNREWDSHKKRPAGEGGPTKS